jgi:hypothetical protein
MSDGVTKKLSYPQVTQVHKIFQQHLISVGYLPQKSAHLILEKIVKSYPYCLDGLKPQAFTLGRVVRDLNAALAHVDMAIAWVRGEHDGVAYLAFCNSTSDAASKSKWGLIDAEKEETVSVMKVIVNYMLHNK